MKLYFKRVKYKSKFLLGLIFSLFVHSLFAYYVVYDYHHKPVEVKQIKIEEVEFVEKTKIIKKRLKIEERQLKKKKKAEKRQRKEEKKERKKYEQKIKKFEQKKPLLKEKKKQFIKKKDIELKLKKKELKVKTLDLKVKTKPSLKVKDISTEKLTERKKPILNAHDVEKLLNINEVGDKKISKKTLELADKLKQEVRIKKMADTPKMELKEKGASLAKLDKKIATFNEAPVINISKKELETGSKINVETKVRSNFDVNDMVVLEDEPEYVDTNIKKVSVIEHQAVKIIESKPEDIKPVIKKKKISIDKKRLNSAKKTKAKDLVLRKKQKKKDFEILGEIKDRAIERSVAPKYPAWAKDAGIEANVRVYIEVNAEGFVVADTVRVDITSGYRRLDEYVIEIIKQWKFVPIDTNEIQSGTITFKFKLY